MHSKQVSKKIGIGCMFLLWLVLLPIIIVLVILLAIHVDEKMLHKTRCEDVITVKAKIGNSFCLDDTSTMEISYSVVFASSGKTAEISLPEKSQLKVGQEYKVVYKMSKLFKRIEIVSTKPVGSNNSSGG